VSNMDDIEWLRSLYHHWHTTQTTPKVGRPPQRIEPRKLTLIFRLMSTGSTLQQVAKEILISRSTLHRILADSKHPDSSQLKEAVRRGRRNAKAPLGGYLTELRFLWIEAQEKVSESEHNTIQPNGVCMHDPNDPLVHKAGEIMDLINTGMEFAEGLEKRGIGKTKRN
jgi:hypothetical protein